MGLTRSRRGKSLGMPRPRRGESSFKLAAAPATQSRLAAAQARPSGGPGTCNVIDVSSAARAGPGKPESRDSGPDQAGKAGPNKASKA